MNDAPDIIPDLVRRAQQAAVDAGFATSCDYRTGALLATLAASKPDGRILELGTGVGSAWLLSAMTRRAHLVTVEADHHHHRNPPGPPTTSPRVDAFAEIVTQAGLQVALLDWASGLVIAART